MFDFLGFFKGLFLSMGSYLGEDSYDWSAHEKEFSPWQIHLVYAMAGRSNKSYVLYCAKAHILW